MHHDQKSPATRPETQQLQYPPTVWSRYRQTGMPSVMAFGLALIFFGLVFEYRWLVGTGLMLSGLSFIAGSAAVVLEYRADMRFEREQGDPR